MPPLKKEPVIRVGVIHEKERVEFSLDQPFNLVPEVGEPLEIIPVGTQKFRFTADEDNLIIESSELGYKAHFPHCEFVRVEPLQPETAIFTVHNCTIGISFHWQRDHDHDYPFLLEIHRSSGNTLWAINEVPVELYLESVISSEMSGKSPTELLKAHTIIARSWLIAQMAKPPHHNFLVCHDDHCQRYYGLQRREPAAMEAVKATRGEVLTYQNEIADTRYAKICGGVSENFENCWPESVVPYCHSVVDEAPGDNKTCPDLTVEENVREWVMSRPNSFCNATPEERAAVLNEFDSEIPSLYRWVVTFTNQEVTALIERKSGKRIGKLKSMVPLRRGPSGRIIEMDFIGTDGTIRLDDQLEIRRHLSTSHLYSSCFVVDTEGDLGNGVPEKFILHGGGWGHGVGLCQEGAAIMATRGYSYQQILFHYYQGTELTRWW